jgi:hypothetical protein
MSRLVALVTLTMEELRSSEMSGLKELHRISEDIFQIIPYLPFNIVSEFVMASTKMRHYTRLMWSAEYKIWEAAFLVLLMDGVYEMSQ